MTSINIQPIKIILDTNIPKKDPIPLTKALLHNPFLKNMDEFNEYPYLTLDIEYPKSALDRLSYEKKVDFFFNKRSMNQFLIRNTDYLSVLKSKTADKEQNITVQPESTNDNKKNTDIILKQKRDNLEELERKKSNEESNSYTDELKNLIIEFFENNCNYLSQSKDNIKNDKKDITYNIDNTIKYLLNITEPKKNNDRLDAKYIKGYNDGSDTNIFKNDENKNFKNILEQSKKYFEKIKNELSKINEKIQEINNNEYVKNIDNSIYDTSDYKEGINYKNQDDKVNYYKKFIENRVKEFKKFLDAWKQLKNLEYEKEKKRIEREYTKELNDKSNSTSNDTVGAKPPSNDTTGNEKNVIGKHNILLMLQYLFPTSYPSSKNISDTFSTLILQEPNIWNNLDWTDIFTTSMREAILPEQSQYSYLKVDGKIYTITQITWINDIYNHIKYKKLIKNYRELMEWKKEEGKKIKKEIEKLQQKLQKNFTEKGDYFISPKDIDEFKKIYAEKDSDKYKRYLENQDDLQIGSSQNYKSFFENMKTLIDDFETFIEYIKLKPINFNSILDIHNKITSSIKTLKNTDSSKVSVRFTISEEFNRKLQQLDKDISTIYRKIKIDKEYISRPGINQNFNNDEKIKSDLTTNYSKYTSFSNSLNEFVKPKLDSTNNELQNIFIDFIDNTDELLLFNALMNPLYIDDITKYLKNMDLNEDAITKDDYKKKLDTGILIVQGDEKSPKYEIILRVDLIAGEITEDNKPKINCVYQGEYLGDTLDKLINAKYINNWELNPNRFFFDLTKSLEKILKEEKGEAKKGEDTKKEEAKKGEEATKEKPKLKGGDIQYTRKLRSFIVKTKKNHYYSI